MQYSVKSLAVERQRTECAIVPVFESRKLEAAGKALDKANNGRISAVLKSGFTGKEETTRLLDHTDGVVKNILLVGMGDQAKLSAKALRKAAGAAATALNQAGIKEAANYLTQLDVPGLDAYWRVRHAVEAMEHALYQFDQCKSTKGDKIALKRVTCSVNGAGETRKAGDAAKQGVAIAAGVNYARDLGNLPGNICTPSYLASEGRKLARDYTSITTKILSEAEMKRLGMGALLSVSRGSVQPAKLIIMQYNGGKKGAKPYALVGKGLTFDAGGISLKPAPAMDEMKYDMCGGASVFGAIKAIAELKLPINVVGVVPSSENMPDGDANKPGDIVTTMSGQTVEVLNTDAEGRLILCDALTYTERFKPQTVVNMATLTGACVIALGQHASGLFSQDEELAADLLEAGEITGDRAWRMPLWDDYQGQLKSNFADFANIGGKEAGAVTAACFLSRFTSKFRWAHLDIAGSAWLSGAAKGATGRPVSLLVQYLMGRK